MEIFIIGAGLLGKFLVDIVEASGTMIIGGFFDDNYPNKKKIFNYPVLGKLSDIKIQEAPNLCIGIGEPKYRKKIFEEKNTEGYNFPSLIHSSVVLSKHCNIEEGVIIGPNSSVLNGSNVRKGSCLLSHVNVNQDVLIEPFCLVAAGVIIGNNAILCEGCHIGLGNFIKLNQKIESWTHFDKVR